MNNEQKNIKGFTAMEAVIYTSVFIIVTVVLTSFISSLITTQTKIRISKKVLNDSQRAMETMIWEIQHATDVYESTSVFDSNPGQLSLETTKNTPQGETTTFIDFYLDDNDRLCLKREGASGEPLVSENVKISNLTFNFLTASGVETVRINLLAVYDNPSGQISHQATTTLTASAVLRN